MSKSRAEQRTRLREFLAFATNPVAGQCNFGAMLYIERPGDVCFLAPVVPELRGVEIVSASDKNPDGKDFDIWKKGKLLKTNLAMGDVLAWLEMHTPRRAESTYRRHIASWVEDVSRFYHLRER